MMEFVYFFIVIYLCFQPMPEGSPTTPPIYHQDPQSRKMFQKMDLDWQLVEMLGCHVVFSQVDSLHLKANWASPQT